MIPAGPVPANPSELLYSPRLTQALAVLERSVRHIVIDTPPLLGVSDTLVLAPRVEGILLVLRHGHAARDAAQRAVQMLGSVRARLLGVVLNHADARRTPGGYQYYRKEPVSSAAGDVGPLDDERSIRIVRFEIRSGRPLVTTTRVSVVLVDLLLAVAANYFAFWLRFDGAIPAAAWSLWAANVPALVLLRGLSFVPFHVYDSVWSTWGSETCGRSWPASPRVASSSAC